MSMSVSISPNPPGILLQEELELTVACNLIADMAKCQSIYHLECRMAPGSRQIHSYATRTLHAESPPPQSPAENARA